jgi:hypothetical protein
MVNTFLPYDDLGKSLACLDVKRLGKQRVETYQLIRALTGQSKGWRNHPACKMWEDNIDALKLYFNISVDIWKRRGYKNTMQLYDLPENIVMPSWFGDAKFHASHRSNLLRKDPIHYGQFGWTEPDNLEYVWPKNRE